MLAVVLYHAGIGPVSGYAGVDVFFVISGYLITWLLAKEKQEHGRIDLLGFYARRVRRILPAAMLMIFSTVLLSCPLLPYTELQQVYQSAIAGLLFVANLFFLNHSGGYFDHPTAEMPLLHLWSLSVEEQFYLIWPLILIVFLRTRAKPAMIFCSALALASLAFSEYLIAESSSAAFYLMPARFWELAVGGLIALCPRQVRTTGIMAAVGLAALSAGLALPSTHFPGLGALPAVTATALLLWLLHTGSRLGAAGGLLRFAPVNYVGRISYSLYLWHWPLLALYHATSIGVETGTSLEICALAVLLAALTYRYVEMPCRTLSVARHRGVFVISGGTATICIALAIAALSRPTVPAAVSPIAAAAVTAAAAPQGTDFATRSENDRTPIPWRCFISPVRPPDQLPGAGCASLPGVKPKVAVLGDSYGNSWEALGWAIGQKLGLSAIDYSRSACPPFLSSYDEGKPVKEAMCRAFNANTVAKMNGFDTVLIASRWDTHALEIDKEGISATLAVLAPTVRKIYIMGPSPVMRDRVPKCIRANKVEACAILRKEFENKSAPMRAYLLSLTRQYDNVEYIEVSNFLCTRDSCPAVKDGAALYTDESHVTYSTAKKFAAEFVRTMK